MGGRYQASPSRAARLQGREPSLLARPAALAAASTCAAASARGLGGGGAALPPTSGSRARAAQVFWLGVGAGPRGLKTGESESPCRRRGTEAVCVRLAWDEPVDLAEGGAAARGCGPPDGWTGQRRQETPLSA